MPTTKTKIEQIARALFPRYGIKDVAGLVKTIVHYRNRDGHVKIWRPHGGWSWFASPGSTVVTPSLVTLWFPADYRRDAAQARDDLYRQLESAALSVLSEDEVEAVAGKPRRRTAPARSSAPPPREASAAQIERDIQGVLVGSVGDRDHS